MDKLKFDVPKLPGWVSALIKVGVLGGATIYTLSKSLYNVEGGQRAAVFNRIVGVKEKVRTLKPIVIMSNSFVPSMLMLNYKFPVSFCN